MSVRKWRPSTFAALFMLLVGVILASMPGWGTVYFVWMLTSFFVLAAIALSTFGIGLLHALRGEWTVLRLDALQVLVLVGGMAAFPALLHLSDWVEMLEVRTSLRMQAEASARAGGLPLATSFEGDGWAGSGTLYDRTGELGRPRSQRSPARTGNLIVQAVDSECIAVRHLVGPWYRWSNTCRDL